LKPTPGRKLGLVSCTKSKREYPCPARQLYDRSNLFKRAFSYATEHYNSVGILSAKYGLLLPNEEAAPYNLTLNSMNAAQRRRWSERAFRQLQRKLRIDSFGSAYFYAGLAYRSYLIPLLEENGIRCFVPLSGLSIGKQMAWYLRQE
jgi:hypothetical protein